MVVSKHVSTSFLTEHSWMNTHVFVGADAQEEICRRVTTVKSRLISDILAASGNTLSVNGILNHVSVLIQLPTLIFLYEKKEDGWHLKDYFDYKKTKASRGSLELKIPAGTGLKNFDLPEQEPKNRKPLKKIGSLFRIFETDFYLQIFLLNPKEKNVDSDNGNFVELSMTKLPGKSGNKYSRKETHHEYARLSLTGLMTLNTKYDEKLLGSAFIEHLKLQIREIFRTHQYSKPENGRRGKTPLQTLSSKIDNTNRVEKFMQERAREAIGSQHGLDRVYERSSYASKMIKLLGQHQETLVGYPNLLFSLRVYDRSQPRAERHLEDGTKFNGYMHNVSFAIPMQQQNDFFDFILTKSNGKYDGEIFGEKWIFRKNNIENAAYANFAKSLDQIFWKLASRKIGVNFILKILNSTVGSQATSIVDAVFYYGTAIYRMPFRRAGGLGRIHGLETTYEQLPLGEKEKFSINHVKDWEVKQDCLRVVIFFYMTRMLATDKLSQEKYWTKIHLFPIDIASAVVGAIACISYELKEPEVTDLPVDSASWNQEFYFFTEIVASAQRVLRQQYRDFQIHRICVALEDSLVRFISQVLNNNRIVTTEMLERMENELNFTSQLIARICPYPAYRFSISEHRNPAWDKNNSVMIGPTLNMKITHEPEWDIFRLHKDLPGIERVLNENKKSLLTKMQEKIKISLETAAFLVNQEISCGVKN